jgi:hypothetical protein
MGGQEVTNIREIGTYCKSFACWGGFVLAWYMYSGTGPTCHCCIV